MVGVPFSSADAIHLRLIEIGLIPDLLPASQRITPGPQSITRKKLRMTAADRLKRSRR